MSSQLYDCKVSTCSTLADQSLVVWHHHATLKATQWVEEVAWVVAAATQWVAAVAATQWAAEEVRTPCFRLGSVALHSFPSFQVFVDVHSLITNRFFFDGHTNTAGMGGGNSMGGGGGMGGGGTIPTTLLWLFDLHRSAPFLTLSFLFRLCLALYSLVGHSTLKAWAVAWEEVRGIG